MLILINMLCLIMFLLICHLVITKTGFIYVESEILREGNHQLLNNLEEGVMIFEEHSLKLVFKNEAARMLDINYSGSNNKIEPILDSDEEQLFAQLDTKLFKQPTVDLT